MNRLCTAESRVFVLLVVAKTAMRTLSIRLPSSRSFNLTKNVETRSVSTVSLLRPLKNPFSSKQTATGYASRRTSKSLLMDLLSTRSFSAS